MKVEGTDVLNDVTRRTSRNLKGVSAVVIAVELFNVKLADLSILGVPLPSETFSWVAFSLLLYLMTMLVWYWWVDFLLWRDGRILTANEDVQRYLQKIDGWIDGVERHGGHMRDPAELIKATADHLAAFRKEVMSMRRSLRSVERSVRWLMIGGFLILPEVLGMLAILSVLNDLSTIRAALGIETGA